MYIFFYKYFQFCVSSHIYEAPELSGQYIGMKNAF